MIFVSKKKYSEEILTIMDGLLKSQDNLYKIKNEQETKIRELENRNNILNRELADKNIKLKKLEQANKRYKNKIDKLKGEDK